MSRSVGSNAGEGSSRRIEIDDEFAVGPDQEESSGSSGSDPVSESEASK